jgi:hypothetical protein
VYGKSFESKYTGSMFGLPLHVWVVWDYCISCKKYSKKTGDYYIELNPVMLAPMFSSTAELMLDAIRILCQPDTNSRGKAHGGRRLLCESSDELIQGPMTFTVVNAAKYQKIRDQDEKRDADASRMREKRSSVEHSRQSQQSPYVYVNESVYGEEKNLSSRDEKEEPSFALAPPTSEHIQSKAKKTKPPANFEPSQATLARAAELGEDWAKHWQDCSDWAASNGKLKADWQATLRNWMSGSKGKYPTRKAMAPKLQEPAQPPKSPEITDADRQRQLAAREQSAIDDRLARGIAPPDRTMFTDTERKRILSGAK